MSKSTISQKNSETNPLPPLINVAGCQNYGGKKFKSQKPYFFFKPTRKTNIVRS